MRYLEIYYILSVGGLWLFLFRIVLSGIFCLYFDQIHMKTVELCLLNCPVLLELSRICAGYCCARWYPIVRGVGSVKRLEVHRLPRALLDFEKGT